MHAFKMRTIIRDHQFDQEMVDIEASVKRADEFLEGVEIILSRSPESGSRLSNSSVWFVPGYTVDLALYYTFDENNVYFLSIQKTSPPQL
jgi:hypothetical protein